MEKYEIITFRNKQFRYSFRQTQRVISIIQIDSSPVNGNVEFVHKCQFSFCVRQNYVYC